MGVHKTGRQLRGVRRNNKTVRCPISTRWDGSTCEIAQFLHTIVAQIIT